MSILNVQNKMCALSIKMGYTVYASGPITKQPGSVSSRVVLIVKDNCFVVCNEYFPRFPSLEDSHFESSTHFGYQSLRAAVRFFGTVVAEGSVFMDSLYREDPIKVSSYKELCECMQSRKEVIIKNKIGMINSISAEDGSGRNWNVTLHTGEKVFIKSDEQ